MKSIYCLFIILIPFRIYSQRLHHQMLSSQGGTTITKTGVITKYSVSQKSVTGTKTGNVIVQQGFQQSNWEKLTAINNVVLVNITTFPNPFTDVINFQFSQPIGEKVFLLTFDVLGRQVYSNTLQIFENKTSVNLQALQNAEYFVQLSNNIFTYHTKIIKN